jgi:hypothetical protein
MTRAGKVVKIGGSKRRRPAEPSGEAPAAGQAGHRGSSIRAISGFLEGFDNFQTFDDADLFLTAGRLKSSRNSAASSSTLIAANISLTLRLPSWPEGILPNSSMARGIPSH